MDITFQALVVTVIASPIVSTITTLFIEHFLNKSRLKAERESSVEREILFNLQKQAEKFFFHLNKLRWNLDQSNKWLVSGDQSYFSHAIKNDQKETLEQLSSCQVYFSKEIFNAYNKVEETFKEYISLSAILLSKENNANELNRLSQLADAFNKYTSECRQEILKEIRNQKDRARK